MGGKQVGQKGIFDNIFARMQKDMGKNIKEVNGLKGKRGLKVWYFFGWVAT